MIDEIEKAPKEMREMLVSVYNYNSKFLENEEQERFLARILKAMSIIDRKFFVLNPEDAYMDTALLIGEGQTISQPSTVARMLLLAELKKGDKVLEVGSGSGWNACLISYIVYPGRVTSIDRIAEITKLAGRNIVKLKNSLEKDKSKTVDYLDIRLITENFFSHVRKVNCTLKGADSCEQLSFSEHPKNKCTCFFDNKKYDKIIITAGISGEQLEKIEELAGKLLNKNGILVCPKISGKMITFKKDDKLNKLETKEEYVFVPLVE